MLWYWYVIAFFWAEQFESAGLEARLEIIEVGHRDLKNENQRQKGDSIDQVIAAILNAESEYAACAHHDRK